MNYLAARVEMKVRHERWGSGFGGVEKDDDDFIQVTEYRYYDKMKKKLKKQLDDRSSVVQKMKAKR